MFRFTAHVSSRTNERSPSSFLFSRSPHSGWQVVLMPNWSKFPGKYSEIVHCIVHFRLEIFPIAFKKSDELTNIMQLLLPSELKHRIVELSSQDTLASLARTHTTFQRIAEQALYRTLSDPSLKCLETLFTNSKKAGCVYFLSMEHSYRVMNGPKGIFTPPRGSLALPLIDHYLLKSQIFYLLNAQVNMHRLSDLRLRMPWADNDKELLSWIEGLNMILWSVY